MIRTYLIPIKTVSEANQREHWAKKSRRVKGQRKAARLMVRPMPLPVLVTMTRISPGTLDDDNLRGALKAIRDGITDAMGLADDSDPRIKFEYKQSKGKDYAVQIEVAEVSDD